MDDISNPFRMYQTTGKEVRLINGNGCDVTKLYVVRSHSLNPYLHAFDMHTSFAPSFGLIPGQGFVQWS
ncbi:hypothetical protein Acr_19g0001450 [Actinidia rufa]|uniref:Uncharacterized protein n=1 Tax=Actinidia rufa TaxID=165716 RepID=A0A7J0G927_9ERIC|nr:hypothetical protein Acr_19g0001450 [Actinidia rufa]